MELSKEQLESDFSRLLNQMLEWRKELESIQLKTEEDVTIKCELWNKYQFIADLLCNSFGIEYDDYKSNNKIIIK